MRDDNFDCLVIGGGPAGLTAAIYLARFHLRTHVVDAGNSRAALIPESHNHAGHPDGIGGPALLERMRLRAERFGATFERGEVTAVVSKGGRIVASVPDGTITADAALLATGVVNRRPEGIDEALHAAALAAGRLRYCPICDGYEVTDRRVGVIGTGEHGAKEALFLRSYTADVTLIAADGAHELADQERATLAEAGIGIVDGPCRGFAFDEDAISVETSVGPLRFDSIYPALGSVIRSRLADNAGALTSPEGCLVVDGHQRTSVPGLYAAGDVVLGLDQISHGMGEGGVAATTMRNDLAGRRRLWRGHEHTG